MWVLGWPLHEDRAVRVALKRGIAKPEWSEDKKIDALLMDIIRYRDAEAINVLCCRVGDTVLPVVSLCTDDEAQSEEEAIPQNLPPKYVAQRVQKQLGYKSGPWWFRYS